MTHPDLSEPLLPSNHSSDDVEPQRNNEQENQKSAMPTRESSQTVTTLSEESHEEEEEQGPSSPSISSDAGTETTSNIDPWKNHNVRLSLALCLCGGVSDSIWGAVVLSGFLYALAEAMQTDGSHHHHDEANTLVGVAEMVQGMTMLVSALPIGIVADLYGKSRVVAYGGALMLATIAMSIWAVTLALHSTTSSSNHPHDSTARYSYHMMLVALGLWGIVSGISNGPSQALFADSIQKGKRSELLTWLYSCYLLASTVGPIVSIVLLLKLSRTAESWSLQEIYPVFMVGLLLEIPSAILMFFFSDKHVVPDPPEDAAEPSPQLQQPIEPQGSNAFGDTEAPSIEEEGDAREQEQQDQARHCSRKALGKAAIPYVLFLSSLITALGSGASVKFFPLFFKELGFSSAAVQGIFLGVPVSVSAFSFLSQKLSRSLGRIETCLINYGIGVSLLLYMTHLAKNEAHLDAKRSYFIVFIYLIRTGIMNGHYPLLESVLMDNVPSKQRARWKSLESIAAFGWTGSALVGGILADERSYRFTFSITAFIQLAGALLLITIQPFVEAEEVHEDSGETATDVGDDSAPLSQGRASGTDNVTGDTDRNDLSEPLLSE